LGPDDSNSHIDRPALKLCEHDGAPRFGVARLTTQLKEEDMSTTGSVPRRHLTVAEVCTELGVARSTFYDWHAARKGPPCFKLPNGNLRIRRPAFDRWLESLQESA
jgi:predicted DNA-binding transcriptional regulator AlpA